MPPELELVPEPARPELVPEPAAVAYAQADQSKQSRETVREGK